ncbi:hypothetical protein AG1IA_06934 [Rhizoctonia solani AG-1 IA]|uniref:Uncharacterized protein n=1 Tax=Thanatephorus cucumeris (strain AG1-IA) TaxID=983506 RepID=L8WRN1_THACA|nr:hypothetical protein AG1IA_06934 [Rhizoctonia solani AG-1 IA]
MDRSSRRLRCQAGAEWFCGVGCLLVFPRVVLRSTGERSDRVEMRWVIKVGPETVGSGCDDVGDHISEQGCVSGEAVGRAVSWRISGRVARVPAISNRSTRQHSNGPVERRSDRNEKSEMYNAWLCLGRRLRMPRNGPEWLRMSTSAVDSGPSEQANQGLVVKLINRCAENRS